MQAGFACFLFILFLQEKEMMDLRNSGRRVVKAAEEALLFVNAGEKKVRLRGRGHSTQVRAQREREVLCKLQDAGGWATTCHS